MEENIQEQGSIIKAFYEEKLFPVLFKRILDHQEAIIEIEALQKALIHSKYSGKNKIEVLSDFANYKQVLDTLINNYFDFDEVVFTEEGVFFNEYYTLLNTHINSLDMSIVRAQNSERFNTQESDSKLLKFKKGIKCNVFKLSKLPVKFVNIFRKNKKEIHFWNHTVPFQNITQHYFKSELIKEVTLVVNNINKEISEITNSYWLTDKAIDEKIIEFINEENPLIFSEEKFNTEKTLPELNERIEKHKQALDKVFENTLISYADAIYKVDTFELPSSCFNIKRISQAFSGINRSVLKNYQQWINTYNVLSSDWELDIEIYITIFKILTQHLIVNEKIIERASIINCELDNIRLYIDNAKQEIDNATTTVEIKKSIVDELNNSGKNFKKIIKTTATCISNQELAVLINEFEEATLGILKSISTKRAISVNTDYSVPTVSTAMNYISPYELITYESWPMLAQKIKKAKVETAVKLNDFIDDVNALGQVSDFNLESALSLFDTVSQDHTPKMVALEGFKRTTDKIEDLKALITNVNLDTNELLTPGIEKFNKSILALTDTENIIEIRLTIAKAKSIEKSKQLREKALNTLKNFVPIVLVAAKTTNNKVKTYIKGFLLRSGLYKEPAEITTDLSNFLKEAEKALDALPYVYQRLFRSETLQNEDLFIGRQKGLETLSLAHTAFNNEQYAATIVMGERGAGKTSLIHYFLKNNNTTIPNTIFLSPTETMSSAIKLNEFLNSSFSQNFDACNQWVDFFNEGDKKIIILENIQYLYCRKVNGFEALEKLSELVSSTKKSVFWIFTCSKYAYEYLNKSIQLSELFSFKVEIDDIDKETMTDALIKRHKISGYNLYFEKPPQAYLSKKFIKSATDIQQQLLREEFFSDIHKIAQSNFKIAFMYWIRSATSISGSTINMRSLKTMDLSFLNKLAPAKLMLLNIILVHDRLKLEDIITLINLDDQQVKRMIHSLYEDGLLTIDDTNYYSINILLYRQITTLLKSKNLIH